MKDLLCFVAGVVLVVSALLTEGNQLVTAFIGGGLIGHAFASVVCKRIFKGY